jgi:hypothetical protein
MRAHSLLISALVIAGTASAQGILNNGAYIVMSNAAQIYIDGNAAGEYTSQANGRITPSAAGIITLEGDWNNNAGNTGFTADAGTVVMNGAAQSITGSSSTTFYNLTLQGTGTKTLGVNTVVGGVTTTTGVLSLGTRPLDLNSFRLDISNPATTAVTFTTGYVISETNSGTNPSIMRWRMGATTGNFVFPFGTTGGVQIPLTFNKTVATSSTVDIATRPTATSANTPWAGGVTHMYDPTLAQDGSDEAVIDRWWEMTASASITANVTFSYRGAENTLAVPYNTGNLGAQWWSAAWLPNNANIGSAPAVLAGVGSVTANALTIGSSYTPWVLSSLSAPLPVELVSFTSQCSGNHVELSWTTASEVNNSFFIVQRSEDGVNFRDIGTRAGNGTTSQLHAYSFIDTEPTSGTTYYRLRQTDYNGQFTTTPLIVQEQCGNGGEVISSFSGGSNIVVDIYTPAESDYTIHVYDDQGKLVFVNPVFAGEGSNRFEMTDAIPAVGIYMITVTGASGISYSNKVYVQK